MSTTATDLEAMEHAKRRVKQDARMRAINRLRRLNTMMSQYSRHIVTKFVDDETVSVERFRLLVVLAGFRVNALFAQENGKAVPCTTKVEIAERMKRVDEVATIGEEGGSGGKQMGGSPSRLEHEARKAVFSNFFKGAADVSKDSFTHFFGKPYIALRNKINSDYPKMKIMEKETVAINILKIIAGIFLTLLVNRLLFNLPSNIISFVLFSSSSKHHTALSYDDIRALPLRPGWEMRETTKGKIYFFHKPTKMVDARIPVLSDEVPHNWVEWITPDTNESEYENIHTNDTLAGDDGYEEFLDDIFNGELKHGWTESKDDKNQHQWHPPVQSPYKDASYDARPLEKPRLENQYGVMAWEYWVSKRRNYASGEVRYQFLQDADTDLYFYTLQEVEREHSLRARGEGTPAHAAKPSVSLPKSKSAENMADIQHELDQVFTFTNVFALRVALAAGAGALALPFALRKYAKLIDNRAFAKVLAAPEGQLVAVAKDICVPTQTAYQHTLVNVDYDLHLKFLECGDDIGMLRDRLLRIRKAREAFHQRRLLPYHLIRTNGEVRESPNEIACAIAHHWKWGNLLGIVTTRTRTAFRRTFGKRPTATQKKRISTSESSTSRRSGNQRRSATASSSSRSPSAAAAARASSARRRTIAGGRRLSRHVIRR